jgi:formate hydrogenlyase subunit 4
MNTIVFNTSTILIGIIQFIVIILLSPLVTGVMCKVKSKTQKRIGFSIFQPYYDILKLLRKDEVISDQASWIFRFSPWIIFSSTVTIALFIPVFVPYSPFNLGGDIILIIGLFGLSRFFTMLSGLDVSSAFGGIGTSREMMISSLLEPAIFLTMFTVSITFGGTNLVTIVLRASESTVPMSSSLFFSLFAFFIIIMAETGKLPFDNPATHLELTMVHEATILEYSGKKLALIELSQSIKQLILMSLLINIFIPWGISSSFLIPEMLVGLFAFLIKVVFLCVFVAYIESKVAKWRLFRIPDLIAMSIAGALLGMIFLYI